MTAQKKPLLNRMRARLHILAKEAGMDDDAYRQMLVEVGGLDPAAGKPSSGRLTAAGLGRVLDHLSRLTGADPLRPPASEIEADPQLRKINALLADAKRPWGYLLAKGEKPQSMLRRITGKDRLRFCTSADFSKVIAALEIDKGRREARG